ncbi:DUF6602 domain-containing protein [Paenibacillus popilliae]|uniref:DUF6602 domain-containing protein n=1 Tax=Paenibacillus popilliae ATCC 14706 TaxID=1212764 RepID=M9M3T7_PAEPP|nr:DUF6602 domain-containing protein [Paenibacillus popilliae]GAC41923.1 hypothetical protein PPOP_1280 [Paenibacillus popilliae ATCC 14706]
MSEPILDHKIIQGIASNYRRLEQAIVDQLRMSSHHHVTSGGFREEMWKQLFEQIIPKKYSVARSVFIIDSEGKVSKEVDLAIFDEQYTPYIFRYGQMKYIPIEAVAVAIQCKSSLSDYDGIKDWTDSIAKLNTSMKSITRIQSGVVCGEFDFMTENGEFILREGQRPTAQTATRPLIILCHLDEGFTSKNSLVEYFDFIICPTPTGWLRAFVNKEGHTLEAWYEALNHTNEKYKNVRSPFGKSSAGNCTLKNYKVHAPDEPENDISLLTLTFQLNQLLMLINNPILFPHQAYVEMFNRSLKE